MAEEDVRIQKWLWTVFVPFLIALLVLYRLRRYIYKMYIKETEEWIIRYFANKYSTIQHNVLAEEKRIFFEGELKNIMSPTILELGNSYGMNFQCYPYGSKVSYISILGNVCNEELTKHRAKRNRYNSVQLEALWTLSKELEIQRFLKESKLKRRDVIVINGLLCRFPDTNLVLSSISQWIKKGGQLLVIEHVGAKTLCPTFLLQKIFWRINWRLPYGCDVTRRFTLQELERAGFTDFSVREIWTKKFTWTWFLYRPYVFVSCVKK